MNQQTTAVIPKEEREIEYVPFGGDQKIALSISMVQKFLAPKTAAGHMCSQSDAVKFLMLCKARALNPWEGDCFLVGYDTKEGPNFTLITAHQAFLKRAEVNPDFDGMQSGVIVRTEKGLEEHEGDFVDDDEELLGGWAKVHFKGRKFPIYRRLHIGSFSKGTAIWKANPAGMIVKTAEADALRSAFPTKCGGMYLQQEMEPGSETAFRNAKALPLDSERALTNGNGAHSSQDGPAATQANGTTFETPLTRQNTPEASPQEKLKVFVEQEGYDLAVLDFYLEGTGNKPENTEFKSFDDIPSELAERIIRAKNTLKKGLANAKGAMAQ